MISTESACLQLLQLAQHQLVLVLLLEVFNHIFTPKLDLQHVSLEQRL